MTTKRRFGIGPIVLLAIVATGCATKTRLPVTDRVRGDLGVVAVVMSADSPPDATLAYPVPSRAAAATVGASAGLGAGVLAGAACFGSYGLLWPACLVALWTPVMMTTGAVEGAVKGVSISDFRDSAVAIKDAAREPEPARSLGEHVVGEATGRLGEGRARFVSDAPRPARRHVEGATTVLELRLSRVALERAPNPGPLAKCGPSFSVELLIDAPLVLLVEVRARLFRAADESIVWEGEFTQRAGSQKLTEWGRDNAAEFRRERDRALTALAEEIGATVFGPAPPASVSPAEPAPPSQSVSSWEDWI